MFALCNGIVLTGFQKLTDIAVIIDGHRIHAIVPHNQLDHHIERYDLHGRILCPGFIDIQLNGCGGMMFNHSPNEATLTHMHQTNLQSGTTSFLPTLISDSDPVIQQALGHVKHFMQTHPNQVLGMHLEGPYTNPIRKGIHPKSQLRRPSDAMIDWLCEQSPWLKILTLAPECNDPRHIRQLTASGIHVSIGHSAATYEQAMEGFQNGVSLATHLHNAMSAIANGREPGVVGAVFDRKTYAGIIADGCHVHWANVRIAKQQLGDKLCLITDGTAGSNPPADMTQFDFCGATIYIKNGSCYDGKGTLGGSSLTMNKGVQLLVEHAGITLEEAVRMATLYPARAIQVDDHLGAIVPGYTANLTIMDHNYQVTNTLVNGQWTTNPI